MSLLLDARKKSQQAQSAQDEGRASQTSMLNLEEHPNPVAPESDTRPIENARSAGQNLFAAKSPLFSVGRTLPNRNLLLALGGTILLLAIGAGYFWYLDSASNTKPLHPISAPPVAPPAQAQPTPQGALVPGIAGPGAAGTIQESQPFDKPVLSEAERLRASGQTAPASVANAPAEMPQARGSHPASPNNTPIRIEQRSFEPLVNPLLNDAYLAYRSGKLDEAQQLYLTMFKKDARDADALLGLAAIAQQRGEDQMAAQYYARVLALDPRNAVANAGMSALTTDDNSESRLKTLLREQGNSAALHFALGNLYAGQSRWGEAQQAYFNAYTLESGNAEYAFNLAVSLDHLGQKKLAARHYQRAIQLDPSNSAGFDHAQISQHEQELTR
ncbi:MAG: tetratricopeptide repeat protein [Gallionella sp.]|nr:tetratricopeptide repeat protein [Gallionella sp.]